jgi:hypothetical protein
MSPVDIRLHSRGARPTTAEARAIDMVRERLEEFARHLRRVVVRLEQRISGPGKVDQACRVEVTLVNVDDAPQLLVEGRAPTERAAVDQAADAARIAVQQEVERAERRRHARRPAKTRAAEKKAAGKKAAATAETVEDEELELAKEAASHHFTPRSVKTAHPRRGRHIHKTQRQARATSAREVSATTPSRKSTRRSANRSKRDSNLARRTQRSVRSPEERATRAGARTTRVRRRAART